MLMYALDSEYWKISQKKRKSKREKEHLITKNYTLKNGERNSVTLIVDVTLLFEKEKFF